MNEPRFLDFNLSKKAVKHLRQKEKILLSRKKIFISVSRWSIFAILFFFYSLYFMDAENMLIIFTGILPCLPLGFGLGNIAGKVLFRGYFHLIMQKESDYRNYKYYEHASKNYQKDYEKHQRKVWMDFNGRRFESEVIRLLKKSGYKIRRTRMSDTDPVAFWIGNETIVHCNAFNTPITPDEVKQFEISLNYSDATKAIMISKSGFSSRAYKVAENSAIRLWDLNQILDLQQKFDS